MIKNVKLKQPIIIFGTGRSGTTIISEILFSHKDLAWPSNYSSMFPKYVELNIVRKIFQNKLWYLQGQKQQLNSISRFNRYLFKPSEAYPLWDYLTGPNTDFSRSFLSKVTETDRIDFIRNYFMKLTQLQGNKRLSFKYTGPSRIKYFQSLFPDAIFIEVKRKLLPTISSFLNVPFWKERGYDKLWWYGAYTDEEKEFADKIKDHPILITSFQLTKIRNVAEQEVAETGVKHLSIDYEDFLMNTNSSIENILSFIGLELDEGIEKYLKQNQIFSRNKSDNQYFDHRTRQNIKYIVEGKFDNLVF